MYMNFKMKFETSKAISCLAVADSGSALRLGTAWLPALLLFVLLSRGKFCEA